MKAILHYRAGPELRKSLADNPPDGWNDVVVDESDVEAFEAELADADVLLHVLCPIGRAQMEKAPKLKLIQKIGVGIDTIDTIAKMKDGAVLINTARGGLVNEADLFDALQSGKPLGAGLDVLNTEPAPADAPLLALPNVVALPVQHHRPARRDHHRAVAYDFCGRL